MQESFIVWVQSHLHPGFDGFFKNVTLLGGFEGFILVVAFVIWSVSYSFGCRLFFLMLLSGYLTNFWIKPIVGVPRPYLNHPAIIPLVTEKGIYSFPSGHAQNSMVTWGALAFLAKKRWGLVLAALLIFLIGFSRIYLGVHYPIDVLGGWVLGALYLGIFIKVSPPFADWMLRLGIMKTLVVIFLIALVLSGLLVFFGPIGNPVVWQITAFQLFCSTSVGWVLQNRYVGFEAGGPWVKRMLRFVLGAPILLVLFYYSKTNAGLVTLAGLWLTLGAPYCFKKVRFPIGKKGRF